MSIEDLRAKALSYSPELPYPVVLDRGLKYRLSEAQRNLAAARAKRQSQIDNQSDADRTGQRFDEETPTVRADLEVADAEAALSAAEEEARPESLVLLFRRLPATGEGSYQEALDAHTDDKGVVRQAALSDALLSACYLRTEAADGQDVGLLFAEAMTPLDHGDVELLRAQIIGHHRIGASVSFDPRSSGRPATS